MFDFLDNDIFVIVINIAFLLFIIFDLKKYRKTKNKMLLVNIAATIGFAIWVMIPFYNKYFSWTTPQVIKLYEACEHNQSMCDCLTDKTIKAYSFDTLNSLDKTLSSYTEFIKESNEECLED